MIIPAKHVTNWRAEMVCRPAVIRRLHKVISDDWIPAWHFRETVEAFAEGMRERDAKQRSYRDEKRAENMARNSDKLQLLQRRRLELRHAIEHGMSAEAIANRCEKFKEAAVAVVKKTVVRCHPFRRAENDANFQETFLFWQSLSVPEIIEINNKWPERVNYQDVRRVAHVHLKDGTDRASDGD